MGTDIRANISKRNPYWIEKHRYYELKHFCLQYPIWLRASVSLDGLSRRPDDLALFKTTEKGNPTERCAEAREFYMARMGMIRRVAKETDPEYGNYILTAVTQGVSYETLQVRMGLTLSKDAYYKLYRKFFWLLSKERK